MIITSRAKYFLDIMKHLIAFVEIHFVPVLELESGLCLLNAQAMCCVSEHPCGQASLISSPPSCQAKILAAAEKEKKFPTL